MKETELYQPLKDYFHSLDYEVYSEVLNNDVPTGLAYADVVLKYNNIITVIEMKKTLNFDLLEQCFRWRGVANYTYAAIPQPNRQVHSFAEKVLKDYGIGLLLVDINSDNIFEEVKPRLYRRICSDWSKYLTEGHKDNIGGQTAGGWITPYSQTIDDIKWSLRHYGAMTLDEILEKCITHYMHPKQGVYNALKNIETDWCESFKKNGKTYFRIKEGVNV